MEIKLHAEFKEREHDGGPRGDSWIVKRSLELHEESASEKEFVASHGWLEGFKSRKRIVNSASIQLNQE